jgi:ankyrin repeat protein
MHRPVTRLASTLFVALAALGLGAGAPAGMAATAADPDAPVAEAARAGQVDEVRALLRQGEDVNAAHGDGMTALHWAAYRGDAPLAEILLRAGANAEARTRVAGYTPLLVAARTGHGSVVERLLEAGADPHARTGTGVTALHFAAGSGQVTAVTALLDAGADVDAREEAHGQTPLVFAANRGRVGAIEALVAAGARIDATTRVVEVPRLEAEDRVARRLRRERMRAMAALAEAEETARLEMEGLADADRGTRPESPAAGPAEETLGSPAAGEPDDETPTPPPGSGESGEEAEAAPAPNDRDVAAPAPPDDGGAKDTEGREEIEEPLSYGDLVGGVGGMSPLHHAARQGHREAALALVDAGAPLDLPAGGDGSTPMLLATINGHFDLALELMERGADPGLGNHADVTPLWAAINVQWAPKALYPQPKAHQRQQVDYLDFMERLLAAGVDPDVRTNRHIWFMSYNFDLLGVNVRGSTAFWRAAYAVDVPAMKLLVAYGADPTIPTRKAPERRRRSDDEDDDPSGLPPVPVGGPGVHPIHAASGAGYGQDFAANSHEHAPDGWLPAVRYLVEELGADVNARDQFGYTPVHHAAARGDNELIRYLVEQGADVTLVARTGQTTVDMANGPIQRVEPFPETIELLESLGAVNNHNCLSCE